jgi:hypothetical protein
MKQATEDLKTFTMRIPKHMLIFLKKTAAEQEDSMSSVMTKLLSKYMKSAEAKKIN